MTLRRQYVEISTVTPMRNERLCAREFVRRVDVALRSLTDDYEIIVVDDGSTDTTPEQVKTIAKKDPRVTFFDNPNKVPRTNWRGYDINAGYAARNYGFSIAKGRWITTQDADDASLLNRIEAQRDLAEKYQATLVTIQFQRLRPELLDKKLDVERIFKEKGEDATVIHPETILTRAYRNRGLLMREPFHKWIPFPIKWFPYTRKLFYPRVDIYPGADNCMLFDRKVLDDGVYFRTRNERTWGTPNGRGSGRDFVFRVAEKYKNSWSFKLPLYLWNANTENPDYIGYDKYLI